MHSPGLGDLGGVQLSLLPSGLVTENYTPSSYILPRRSLKGDGLHVGRRIISMTAWISSAMKGLRLIMHLSSGYRSEYIFAILILILESNLGLSVYPKATLTTC